MAAELAPKTVDDDDGAAHTITDDRNAMDDDDCSDQNDMIAFLAKGDDERLRAVRR